MSRRRQDSNPFYDNAMRNRELAQELKQAIAGQKKCRRCNANASQVLITDSGYCTRCLAANERNRKEEKTLKRSREAVDAAAKFGSW